MARTNINTNRNKRTNRSRSPSRNFPLSTREISDSISVGLVSGSSSFSFSSALLPILQPLLLAAHFLFYFTLIYRWDITNHDLYTRSESRWERRSQPS